MDFDFPELLQKVAMGNPASAWIAAAVAFAAAFVAMRVAVTLLGRRLGRLAATTENRLDDVVADLVTRTRSFFVAAVALVVAAEALRLPGRVDALIRHAVVLAIMVQAGIWGDRLVRSWIAVRVDVGASGEPTKTALGTVLRVVGRVVVWGVVVLLVLQNLGVQVTALVAGLGVGGIAVALAVQNVLGDLLASLAIAIDKPFVPGDFIVLDAFQGTVESVGMKSTRLRSIDGERIVLSNGELLKSRVRNYAGIRERRVLFELGVTYQTPAGKVERIPVIVKDAIEAAGNARFDRAHFKSYGDSALVFEVVYFVPEPDFAAFMDVRQRVNLEILRRFQAEGIDFAYPTRTIVMAPPEERRS
jgi:small-conductance mechanosensitive channel